MPPKRKASDDLYVSPSKRATLSKSDAASQDTPSRQTRAGKQPVATSTPITTPKVRRTYKNREEKAPEALQAVTNDVPDNPQSVSPGKSHGCKKLSETQETPSKWPQRPSKASVTPDYDSLEFSGRVKWTYSKKLVVEVPPPPLSAQSLFSPSQPFMPSEPCDPLTTPSRSKK